MEVIGIEVLKDFSEITGLLYVAFTMFKYGP